jgi:hypothetical protein
MAGALVTFFLLVLALGRPQLQQYLRHNSQCQLLCVALSSRRCWNVAAARCQQPGLQSLHQHSKQALGS